MSWLAATAGALVLGVGVPWLGVRMLVPVLEEGARVENYRGCPVFLGLGIAWLLWAGAAIVYGVVASWSEDPDSVIGLLTLAGPLALVAFSLGLVDDAFGSSAARGFKGHLRQLARGRLTTGGLKLIGISAAALVVGLVLAQIGAPESPGTADVVTSLGIGTLGGAAIALTSNFVNLVDLRPGRALKMYAVLVVLGVASTVLLLPGRAGHEASAERTLLDAVSLAVFLLGPVAATWTYDLGERGMLGDAGANAMGAVAGMFVVAGLPLWALGSYAALLFALNVASERVSFSRVIEGNALLRRLDALGRLPAEESSAGEVE